MLVVAGGLAVNEIGLDADLFLLRMASDFMEYHVPVVLSGPENGISGIFV